MYGPKKPGGGAGAGGSTSSSSGPMKPKVRRKTNDARSKSPTKSMKNKDLGLDLENELDELDRSVGVKVRERGPESPPGGDRPGSRLGQFIKDTKEQTKETIKRPLSALLKRPGSRAGSRERSRKDSLTREDVINAAAMDSGDEGVGAGSGRAALPASVKPPKKGGFMSSGGDGRPGTAFGRKFSFGRKNKGKSKKGGADGGVDIELDDDGDADDEYAYGLKREDGMLVLQDSSNGGQLDDSRGGMVNLSNTSNSLAPSGNNQRWKDSGSPDIPELDEIEGTAFGTGVALAPSVAVNQIASFKELDSALMKQAAFMNLGDVDLSLLTRFLCPEAEVAEENQPWTWDYLYTSVCTELRNEWEEEEEEEDAQLQNNVNPQPISAP